MKPILLKNRTNSLPLGPTDWYYRNLVPKGLSANMLFRKQCLEAGYSSDSHRRELAMICSRDILFSINVFGWTLDPRGTGNNVRPFITFPFQDEAILAIQGAYGLRDIAIPKSRDMGASWMSLLVLEHMWRFKSDQQIMVASLNADSVDGDMGSLIGKLRWYHHRTPSWLLPRMYHKHMHYTNLDNGSCIDGTTTVDNLGTGDRRTAILLDELAKIPNARKILTSTMAVSDCRIYNSTPLGSTGVGKPFFERILNPHVEKVFIHWSDWPEKRKGLFKIIDGQKKLLPDDYSWRNDYDFEQLTFPNKSQRLRSPWYDNECRREGFDPDKDAGSSMTIAQELDIDFMGSEEHFVDQLVINQAMGKTTPPQFQGRCGFDQDDLRRSWWDDSGDGPMKLWCPVAAGIPPHGKYSAGFDIGSGNASSTTSNSAVVVIDCKTKQVVARYAVNYLSPQEFAEFAVGVCHWFHGAYMVPESNGSALGNTFVKTVKDLGYGNVYFRQKSLVGMSNKKTRNIGYHNGDRGTQVLVELQQAVKDHVLSIKDKMILTEMSEYRYGKDGKVEHRGSLNSDLVTDKNLTHGDVAIACALAWHGVNDRPSGKPSSGANVVQTRPSYECIGNRFAEHEANDRRKSKGREKDFGGW